VIGFEFKESALLEFVEDLFGNPKPLPFLDVTHDSYDYSFELKGAQPGLQFSPEAIERIKQAGFMRWWICYTDGPESYCGGELSKSIHLK
jgi:hypothetical protein